MSISVHTNESGLVARRNLNRSSDQTAAAQGHFAAGLKAKQIESHSEFVGKLADILRAGGGDLVDADLAKESAHLQALQVQQELGAQELSIANQGPQMILQLFKG